MSLCTPSAVAQIMREQNKQTDDTLDSAQRTIKHNYNKMKAQTAQKREAAERRREAEEDKSAWEAFASIFEKELESLDAGRILSRTALRIPNARG